MNHFVSDLKVPAPAELRQDSLRALSSGPLTAAALLTVLPESQNKTSIKTQQRLSRFLGTMASMGLIKAVKPSGGVNRWSILPQGIALLIQSTNQV